MATHLDAITRFYAYNVILNVHSDASYITAPKAQSRAGRYFFLCRFQWKYKPIFINGQIHVTCSILRSVAALAAEAELGALFINAKETKILQLNLKELGHKQPPMPIYINNNTTTGIVNNTINWQKSCTMEMRYFGSCITKHQKNQIWVSSEFREPYQFLHQGLQRKIHTNDETIISPQPNLPMIP